MENFKQLLAEFGALCKTRAFLKAMLFLAIWVVLVFALPADIVAMVNAIFSGIYIGNKIGERFAKDVDAELDAREAKAQAQ